MLMNLLVIRDHLTAAADRGITAVITTTVEEEDIAEKEEGIANRRRCHSFGYIIPSSYRSRPKRHAGRTGASRFLRHPRCSISMFRFLARLGKNALKLLCLKGF